jgi:hypothetical protein
MAKFGSASITITYDDSAGTPRVVTDYITEMNGIETEAVTEPTHALGDAWEEATGTGMRKVAPIQLKGFYDDTATSGPHAVFRALDDSPSASTRTLAIAFGGTNGTATLETRCSKYKVTGKVGSLTTFEATLTPTGALAWS